MNTTVNFFAIIAGLLENEGDKIIITIQKTGDELTTMTVPHINGQKLPIIISGSPAEIDEVYVGGLSTPLSKVKGVHTNSEEVEPEDDEDDKNETKDSAGSEKGREQAKKAAPKKDVKKAAPKKAEVKVDSKKEASDLKAADDKIKADTKESEKADKEAAALAAEEAKKIQAENIAIYDDEMRSGNIFMDERQYEDAEIHFKSALDLFPDDLKAADKLKSASTFVKLMTDAGIPLKYARKEDKQNGN